MTTQLIDTHCHLYLEAFFDDFVRCPTLRQYFSCRFPDRLSTLCCAKAPIIGRTKRDNLLAALIGLSSLRISNRRCAHGSKSGSSLFRQAGGCFALHSGCQFGYVGRRSAPRHKGRRQGCGRDLQSNSNHHRGCSQLTVKGGKN